MNAINIPDDLAMDTEHNTARCLDPFCHREFTAHEFRTWVSLKAAYQEHARQTGHRIHVIRQVIVFRKDESA